ncbi:hypothetical protein [Bacillus suaedaesalsae]|uniref:Type VII secretion protein EssB n=1 Tax=Bacillus suaedaesalsae TaxID=2810349 RepID=A0ABS2DJQ6_9BACI|nr:hypothetical protein [Bacillus suaedaesalsae]MBM6618730.1 hypothetical protein [Bacillus suaedaesalsae]
MDKLEQRLNQLKNSYEEIPTASNPAKIMEQIKKTKQKQKKKWVTQLPYVASFIGVLIIGSLLAVQMLSSQGTNQGDGEKKPEEKPPVTNEQKVTKEQIAEKQKILVAYYDELLSTSYEHPIVEIKNLEELPYIRETKEFIEEVGEPEYKKYKNEKDLEQSYEEYMAFVKDRFEMPKTDLGQLETSNKEDLSSDVMDIMRKQEELKVHFQKELTAFAISGEILKISQDFFEQKEKLLSVSGIENQELKEFAQYLKDNGYTLIDIEGQHEVEINFQSILDLYGGKIDQDVKDFININSSRLAIDGGLSKNWDIIAEKIIILEESRKNYKGSSKVLMDNLFNEYFNFYFNGNVSKPAFLNDGYLDPELKESYQKFLNEKDPDTEAYKKVENYYNSLKEAEFHKSAIE